MIKCSLILNLQPDTLVPDFSNAERVKLVGTPRGRIVVKSLFEVRIGPEFDERVRDLAQELELFFKQMHHSHLQCGIQFNVREETEIGCGIHLPAEVLEQLAPLGPWIDVTLGES